MSDTILNGAFLTLLVAVGGAAAVTLYAPQHHGALQPSVQAHVVHLPAVHVSGRRVPAGEVVTLVAAKD